MQSTLYRYTMILSSHALLRLTTSLTCLDSACSIVPLSNPVVSDLQDLCETCGPADALNSCVFESLQSAITESPARHASAHPAAGQAKSGTAESLGSGTPVSTFPPFLTAAFVVA